MNCVRPSAKEGTDYPHNCYQNRSKASKFRRTDMLLLSEVGVVMEGWVWYLGDLDISLLHTESQFVEYEVE